MGQGAALHELIARFLGGGGHRREGKQAGEGGNEQGGAHGGFLSAIADRPRMRLAEPVSKRSRLEGNGGGRLTVAAG
ncbi:hypothetical protein D3C72_2203250 [compost metagenome]